MTEGQGSCGNIDCPHGGRHHAAQQAFNFCARLVGLIVVGTTAISISAAVSISTFIGKQAHREHRNELWDLKEQIQNQERRLIRVEATR